MTCPTRHHALLTPVLVACALGTGCALTPTMEPTRAQTELIGMTKEDVIRCAGEPAGETTAGEEAALIYDQQATAAERYFSARGGVSNLPRNCRARVKIKSGRVGSVEYDPTPVTKETYEECDDIFAKCLHQR